MKTVVSIAAIFGAVLLTTAAAQNQKPPAPRKTDSAGHAHADKPAGEMTKHMSSMNDTMMKHLGKKDPDFEKRFIDLMIPHHEGAVLMAKQALKEANRPELKKMSEDIIAAQEKEIEQLKKWRREWYGQP
jgi:uncharacterized protein (DUF305 family)